MKNLSTFIYGLILCVLLVFILKVSTPDVPEGMVLIPAGDGMDGFYMDVYEVTNAGYKEFIDANPQWQKNNALASVVGNKYLSLWNGDMYPKGKADHPVVNVSWFAAKAYAEWVGKDLPTEAQWERAARGTPVGKKYDAVATISFGFPAARATLIEKKYPWGDAEPQSRANYNRYTPTTDFSDPPTKAVGSYLPNEYGLYDMVGNVAEWCLDGLNFDDIRGRYHRVRGGSWFDGAEGIQITKRSQYPIDGAVAILGFRCMLPITETRSTKVETEMAAFLYDEMRNQFDNACYSVSRGYTTDTDLDLRFAEIVMSYTGYPRTFAEKLILIFREVSSEQMESGVLSTIPSPKIVGARSPRPDENRADASAPPSLQGGRSLNIGRGNPAPTEPRRGSYLKILPHTPEGLLIDEMLEHHGAMGCIQDTSIQLKCR